MKLSRTINSLPKPFRKARKVKIHILLIAKVKNTINIAINAAKLKKEKSRADFKPRLLRLIRKIAAVASSAIKENIAVKGI